MTETVNRTVKPSNSTQDQASYAAAFQQHYQTWLTPVYRYFYHRVGNVKDAEDLTAQAFLKAYRRFPQYHENGQFAAWLFTIVRNQVNDFYRAARSASQPLSLEAVDLADGAPQPLAQAVHHDEIQRLQGLLAELSAQEQELIRLRFVAQLGYREIGVLLHRKEDAVRKSIARLLARLQNQLEQDHKSR